MYDGVGSSPRSESLDRRALINAAVKGEIDVRTSPGFAPALFCLVESAEFSEAVDLLRDQRLQLCEELLRDQAAHPPRETWLQHSP